MPGKCANKRSLLHLQQSSPLLCTYVCAGLGSLAVSWCCCAGTCSSRCWPSVVWCRCPTGALRGCWADHCTWRHCQAAQQVGSSMFVSIWAAVSLSSLSLPLSVCVVCVCVYVCVHVRMRARARVCVWLDAGNTPAGPAPAVLLFWFVVVCSSGGVWLKSAAGAGLLSYAATGTGACRCCCCWRRIHCGFF